MTAQIAYTNYHVRSYLYHEVLQVAAEKDKLVDEAQRLLLRGQADKAIKIYQQVLKLDPGAVNHRQKLAELLSKAGNIKGARAEFEVVGRYYASNGFYLKAIAVYKKLQTMFPEDTGITLTLAQLNEKHGLTGNALTEYRQVYDYHMRRNAVAEALLILERMERIDKRNPRIGLMLAEAYFDAGRKEEAYAAFGRVAVLLQEGGDSAFLEQVSHRIGQIFPEKNEFMLDVLACQVSDGKGAEALPGLHTLLGENPYSSRLWDVLIKAYRQLGQPERMKAAALHCLKFLPENIAVRKLLLECLLAEGELASALALVEKHEKEFFEVLPPSQLLDMYQELRRLDPVNSRVLAGLQRAYLMADEPEKAEAIAASISSLNAFSPDGQGPSPNPAPVTAVDDILPDSAGREAVFPLLPQQDEMQQPVADIDQDIEIDIDIDVDLNPGLDLSIFSSGSGGDDDALTTEGGTYRNVRFGSELENSDAQTHYDLGIAFREMGLFDEAAREFMQAAADPARTIACLLQRNSCLREQGDLAAAEASLKILLQQELAPSEFSLAKQELALVYQAAGRTAEAERLLAETSLPMCGKKDSLLHHQGGSLDFTDADIDDFDLK